MGLRVQAIETVGKKIADSWDDFVTINTEDDGSQKYDIVVNLDAEKKHSDTVEYGVYESVSHSLKHAFEAGSYNFFYNEWCKNLAVMVYGQSNVTVRSESSNHTIGDPFYELIDFTSRGGFIGHPFCSKLYKDFTDFEERYIKSLENIDSASKVKMYTRVYENFKVAFKLASNGGVVVFC